MIPITLPYSFSDKYSVHFLIIYPPFSQKNQQNFFFNRNFQECSRLYCIFNTAIVFDRNGQIVAKYDKYHVYEAPYIDKPFYPRPVIFQLDTGHKIGLMVCFDINYRYPAENILNENIDAIVLQVAWTDELPFLTGKFLTASRYANVVQRIDLFYRVIIK